jgi:hypothetical protein
MWNIVQLETDEELGVVAHTIGPFDTEDEAKLWAREHMGGQWVVADAMTPSEWGVFPLTSAEGRG